MIISFNAQTEQQLQFTVILLRILQDEALSLADIVAKTASDLKITDLEVKKVGLLKKTLPQGGQRLQSLFGQKAIFAQRPYNRSI